MRANIDNLSQMTAPKCNKCSYGDVLVLVVACFTGEPMQLTPTPPSQW